MAIIPSDDYAGQTTTGDGGYPHGKAKNVIVAGDGTGTPLEAAWLNDIWGFLQDVLARAGITPSGDPDEVGASDYADALRSLRYNADATIDFAVPDTTPYIKGPNPTDERQLIARFGTLDTNMRVYFSGGAIEFAFNASWVTGVGWTTTGSNEGVIAFQASDSSRGPMILMHSNLVTNDFTETFSIIGDPSTTNLAINGLNPIALSKVIGRVSTTGSSSTPVLAAGSLNIDTPIAGKVTSTTVVIDFIEEFANSNYIPTLTSDSNTEAYIYGVTSRTTALMAVEIFDAANSGNPVNPLTTPVEFFVDIKGAQ
jgi:hypothetical protein